MMPATQEEEYLIAVFSTPSDPTDLSRIFSTCLKTQPLAPDLWKAHVPGLINEKFTREQAELIVESLNKKGVIASAVARDEVPALGHAIPVGHIRCEEYGLNVLDKHGTPRLLIPWNSVEMICTGLISDQHANRNGNVASHSLCPENPDEHRHDCSPPMHLFITSRPPHPPLHLKCGDVRYDASGPPHEVTNSLEFRRLVSDIGRNAADAVLTESTLSYLQDIDPAKYHFESFEHFRRYVTLQALLAREKATIFRFAGDTWQLTHHSQ